MWARPAHKKALDQLWYGGALSTSHRSNFIKYYDLANRIFPSIKPAPQDVAHDWLCHQAIDRLSFGTSGEIARFWDVMSARDVKQWCNNNALIPVSITTAQGDSYAAFGSPDIEERLNALAPLPSRLKILNPFDPAIRDRKRLEKLFGFEYRNEMFVPKNKRLWGYYVYPLLEADKFVGRIELKADRKSGQLSVTGFWPETGVKWPQARHKKLSAELLRFARFSSLSHVEWAV
jgi:uncharacterized protein YcaQ